MTFDASKPDASQSPSLAPAQIQTNWSRIKTIIDADHQFNDTAPGAPSNDGMHNRVTFLNNTVASVPSAGNAVMYSKSVTYSAVARNEVFARNANQEHLVGMRAACSFFVSGGVVTELFKYNVASVSRTNTGQFTITFTDALPTNQYAAVGMAQPPSGAGQRVVTFKEGNAYTDAQTTTTLLIEVVNSQSQFRDPTLCSVLVFGG